MCTWIFYFTNIWWCGAGPECRRQDWSRSVSWARFPLTLQFSFVLLLWPAFSFSDPGQQVEPTHELHLFVDMSVDWEKVNERLPYKKGEEGELIDLFFSIFAARDILVRPHSSISAERGREGLSLIIRDIPRCTQRFWVQNFKAWFGEVLTDNRDYNQPMIEVIPAKEKRKEMWSAIDVNDNGYASLSEITRVSEWRFLIWYDMMSRGFEMWSTPTTSLTRVRPSTGHSTTVENWPRSHKYN